MRIVQAGVRASALISDYWQKYSPTATTWHTDGRTVRTPRMRTKL